MNGITTMNIFYSLDMIAILIAMVVAYMIGSFSMSHLLSKRAGINLKEQGSKNYGASNTLALMGKKSALLVLISDISKSILAIWLCKKIYWFLAVINPIMLTKLRLGGFTGNIIELNMLITLLIANTVIIGHIFPFYLKFKGGKGFAPFIGVVIYLSITSEAAILIVLVMAIILALIFNYIVVATIVVIILTPLYIILIDGSISGLVLLIASIIIFIKHIENFKHIKEGSEMKIREAFKNKYRVTE